MRGWSSLVEIKSITEAKKELDYIKTYHKEDGMFFLRKDVLQIIEELEKSVREKIKHDDPKDITYTKSWIEKEVLGEE